eukprot:CAMPEP_0170743762 /NCGR_PEP_ID=MMETSP0437-20130122/7433_1 /TAXON_ID=0 /ORGANISM="Sexangularia sp." /LENGTH=672 /DNA_ID=CAMNT_0011082437 /DNA_START=29 /DNA_END=2044 /DNA_ORIENTATION=-
MSWKQLFDTNGRPFYLNVETKEKQWTPPAAYVGRAPEWIEMEDEATGALYYSSVSQGGSVWTKPDVAPEKIVFLAEQRERVRERQKNGGAAAASGGGSSVGRPTRPPRPVRRSSSRRGMSSNGSSVGSERSGSGSRVDRRDGGGSSGSAGPGSGSPKVARRAGATIVAMSPLDSPVVDPRRRVRRRSSSRSMVVGADGGGAPGATGGGGGSSSGSSSLRTSAGAMSSPRSQLSNGPPPPAPPRPTAGGAATPSPRSANASASPRGLVPPQAAPSPAATTTPSATPTLANRPVLPTEISQELVKFQLEGFARRYFDTKKKGVFRREVPVEELLVWSSSPISGALTKLRTTALSRDAVNCNRKILQYMGDAGGGTITLRGHGAKNDDAAASFVVQRGLATPELRDELYCQLCKQLNENPGESSLLRGWQLFTMAIESFPPTHDLERWLLDYCAARHSSPDPIGQYARYGTRMIKTWARDSRKVVAPTTTPEQLKKFAAAPLAPSPFGACLGDRVAGGYTVDEEMHWLAEQVIAKGGEQTEGIFRVPADPDSLAALTKALNAGKLMDTIASPHAYGATLKLLLRELAEPLVPEYDRALAAAEEGPDAVRSLVESLAPEHQAAVSFLVQFLQTLAKSAEATRMHSENLAMVFSQSVLRCPSPDPQVMLMNQQREQE